MILLAVEITFGWKMANCILINIITDLPFFSFAKFMDNSDENSMAIRRILFFTDFSENPAPLIIFAINKLINFYLGCLVINILVVMLGDE